MPKKQLAICGLSTWRASGHSVSLSHSLDGHSLSESPIWSNAMTATMTVEQAGALLGISCRSADRAASEGHIPTIRLGRRILVPTAMLYDILGIPPTHHAGSDGSPNQRSFEQKGR